MAKSIWDAAAREALLARFALLRDEKAPQWGSMNASQMVKHCTLPLLAAMGELKVAPKMTPFRFWGMSKLIIYVAPWPKGAPTAPEFIVRESGDLQNRIGELRAALEKFAAFDASRQLEPHAAFGALSRKDWGALTHRHLDHHLRQFGV